LVIVISVKAIKLFCILAEISKKASEAKNQKYMNKYFTEKQIYTSTLLGGPIPPGILIYKNLKNIGEDKKAMYALLFTIAFTVLLFYGLFQLPEQIIDKLPSVLFPALYTGIVYLIYHKYFAEKVNSEIVDDENRKSNWHVAGLTVIGLILNIAIIFVFAFSEPAFLGEKIEYGELKHEIFFNKGEIDNKELKDVGYLLTEFGYFNNDVRQAVKVEKEGDFYTLSIPIQKEFWSNQQLIAELDDLKYMLSINTEKEFKLILIHYDLSGNTERKEI
jgi:hypothetical protein